MVLFRVRRARIDVYLWKNFEKGAQGQKTSHDTCNRRLEKKSRIWLARAVANPDHNRKACRPKSVFVQLLRTLSLLTRNQDRQ